MNGAVPMVKAVTLSLGTCQRSRSTPLARGKPSTIASCRKIYQDAFGIGDGVVS